jgi:DNA replication and repair protein RecF
MILQKLNGWCFKNYEQLSVDFSDQLTCLAGPNGAGKTNLLDAIHYMCLTRSAFNLVEEHNILHHQPQFGLQGFFLKAGQSYHIKCSVSRQQGKVFTVNDRPYDKLRDHVGQFPVVITTPYDSELVVGGSEGRRKFFDALLCQLDRQYLTDLVQYQHVLRQRNGLLRMYGGVSSIDVTLVTIYDQVLVQLAYRLHKRRIDLLHAFLPKLQHYYQYLVTVEEAADVVYQSDVGQPDFLDRYQANLQQDWRMQRTGLGVHRDDFIFLLNGYPLKKFGSQGQQKSFILALRLAQFSCLEDGLRCKPILLLDDIFDKLDEQRIERFIHLIAQQSFGQVILTVAGNKRSMDLFKAIQVDKRLFTVEAGRLQNSFL